MMQPLNTKLVYTPERYKEMIDFFTRDEFDAYKDDKVFFEFFVSYFKNNILRMTNTENYDEDRPDKRLDLLHPDDLFLDKRLRTLQYIDANDHDATVEFDFMIQSKDNRKDKFEFAERGANYCVILPVLKEIDDRDYFRKRASGFYHSASVFTENEAYEGLFNFLEDITYELTGGLENILTNIKQDGIYAVEDAFDEVKGLYASEDDKDISREYARKLIDFGRFLGKENDDIPLRREHYKMLLE